MKTSVRSPVALLAVALASTIAVAEVAPAAGSVAAVGQEPPPEEIPGEIPLEEIPGEYEFPPPPPDQDEDISPYRERSEVEHDQADTITPNAAAVRPIRFPVVGSVSYVDTFGACRDGCSRFHEGIDIFAPKRRHLLAAADGHVTYLRTDASGTAGNAVGITDAQGWRYLYLHVNNDSPNTDDGRNPARWRFVPGIEMGAKVYAGQIIGYLGDSGNAETTPPHLHFEIRDPNLVDINPYPSLLSASRARPDPRLFRFDAMRSGAPDDHVPFGPASTMAVLGCDRDGDGDDEPVRRDGYTFRSALSITDLRISNNLPFGAASDLAFCGDWDGDGRDTIGVRRGDLWGLRNTWNRGSPDIHFAWGYASDKLVIGDWDGDGIDTVGVYRRGRWYLAMENRAGTRWWTCAFGAATDQPIVGDWDGDGDDTIGVRRGDVNHVRNTLLSGGSRGFRTGQAGDWAFSAEWTTTDRDGRDSVSLWRRYPR